MTRFRMNAAAAVAATMALVGAIPLAATRWYLAPLVLIPAAVAVWAWRSGTDADPDGLTVRALFGSRRLAWSGIEALAPDDRGRVYARLSRGASVRLTGVTAADLPRLLAVGSPTADPPDSRAAQ